MIYKRLTALLTLAITAISIYYLTFTFVARRVEREAATYATTTDGKVDFQKKQEYLAKKWKEVVFTMPLTGKEHTYEDVKSKEISLGLDLQHGMHITLKIYVPSIVKDLAGVHGNDPSFKRILKVAEKAHAKNPQKSYVTHFYEVYQDLMPNRPLNTIFFNSATEGVLSPDESDKAILSFIEKRIVEETKRTKKIYEKRLNGRGMGSLIIRLSPMVGVIEVEIQGITSTKRIKKLLESTAQLIFYEIELDPTKLEEVYTGLAKERIKGKKTPLQEMLQLARGTFICEASDIAQVRKRLASDAIAELLPIGYELLTEAQPMKGNQAYYAIYLVKTGREEKGLLSGDVIKKAYHTFNDGKCQVVMEMTGDGAKKWHEVTRSHINQPIGIAMKGLSTDHGVYNVLLSVPYVQQPIPNGISTISGDYELEDSKDFANSLDSGSLPASSKVTGETVTGPTVGEAAQEQAFWVFIIVLLLIILFMLIYYGRGGAVADIALLFNMLFILGTLAQLNAALTLPGIAGILLTFGMSVDANVLIFERIREELKRGVYIKAAITQGYGRAYSSIIDSNLTTLLTGVILYVLGQGPIKGFATTLIIGIISSLFTAVMVTRLLIEIVGPERMGFGFSFAQNLFTNLNINFFAIRKKAYFVSFSLIGIGLVCIKQNGLPKGVDFTGGQAVVVQLDAPVSLEDVKKQVSEDFEHASVEVKTYGSNDMIKITTSYHIEDDSLEADQKTKDMLIKSIATLTGKRYIQDPGKNMPVNSFSIVSSTKVGAAIADYVMMMAIYAVLLALLMIFGYILIRFRRWQFGLAAVLALTHDTLMIFASLGIARAFGVIYEIDQVFVGAVLTVIGYSINDTVVVFDRLRENLAAKGRASFKDIANRSVNETMSRTLITSFTTLIAVLTLFLFGGEALRGFSFTLLIGIVFGTCSSIFALVLAHDLEYLFIGMLNRVRGRQATQ